MVTLDIQLSTPARTGSGYQAYVFGGMGSYGVSGCCMGRGDTEQAAVDDLFSRLRWDVNASPVYETADLQAAGFARGAVVERDGDAVQQLHLIPDGRDISRLVDVMGREIRTGIADDGRIAAYDVSGVDSVTAIELDRFTQAEWDSVLSAGTERPLDVIAGTTVTTINW